MAKLPSGSIATLGTISSERSASAERFRLSGADAEGKTKLPPVAHGDGEGVIIVVSVAKWWPSRQTRSMYHGDLDDDLPRAMPLPKSAGLSKIRWVFYWAETEPTFRSALQSRPHCFV